MMSMQVSHETASIQVVYIMTSIQVVYVTVLAPYVLLTVLLVRGVTLNGSWDGLRLYLNPDFGRLSDPLVCVL